MSQKTIWTIVIVILVILGIWWAVAANGDDPEDTTDANGTNTQQVEDNAIVAVNQRPSDEILISQANLENGGFVVIHDVNEDGSPGEILGSSDYLSADEHSNIEIALAEEPADETELIAMLHTDDGDQTFSAEDDDPILSTLGGPIMMRFMIDTAAGENFDVKL